jgi:hypothetical protein
MEVSTWYGTAEEYRYWYRYSFFWLLLLICKVSNL